MFFPHTTSVRGKFLLSVYGKNQAERRKAKILGYLPCIYWVLWNLLILLPGWEWLYMLRNLRRVTICNYLSMKLMNALINHLHIITQYFEKNIKMSYLLEDLCFWHIFRTESKAYVSPIFLTPRSSLAKHENDYMVMKTLYVKGKHLIKMPFPSCLILSISSNTGAAFTRLVVKTAAATTGSSQ